MNAGRTGSDLPQPRPGRHQTVKSWQETVSVSAPVRLAPADNSSGGAWRPTGRPSGFADRRRKRNVPRP